VLEKALVHTRNLAQPSGLDICISSSIHSVTEARVLGETVLPKVRDVLPV